MRKFFGIAKKDIAKNWQLHTFVILPILYLIIFKFYPILGLQIAFKRYILTKGIWQSPFIGLDNFTRFIKSYQFSSVMINTIVLSFYQLIASFPVPIILAIGLNYLNNKKVKKTIQMVTYAPHFISVVVIVGMMMQFLASRTGIVSNVYFYFTGEYLDILGNENAFRHLYVWSGVWQNAGYASIIYIAALTSVPDELHEAAVIDGANQLRRILHIDLPSIMPTAAIILILNTGRVMNIGFEKAFLMQNPINISYSEIIATYVYKTGLASQMPDFSYSAAIGMFKSVIALVMITSVNFIARKISDSSLW